MTQLPHGWTRLHLGEIAARTKTMVPSKNPDIVYELYSVPSFSDGMAEQARSDTIKSAKQVVQTDDVLLCKIVPHLNRVWVVGKKSGAPQIASGEWIVYRNDECDPHYLRYCLTETTFRDQFMRTVSGVGGSLMRARPSEVSEIAIPLAPLPEQKRIVAKIDSLSGKSKRARDHLEHIPRLVEKYKQAVLAAAFRGDLTREWRDLHSISSSAQDFIKNIQLKAREVILSPQYKRDQKTAFHIFDDAIRADLSAQSDVNPLPQHWAWSTIGGVFAVYIGATPSRKEKSYWHGDVPWVSSGEVAFCRIKRAKELITEAGLLNTSTRLHPQGTVLLGMIGEGKTRGQAAILDIEACNNQNCAAIRVSESQYSSEYIYYYLQYAYEKNRNIGAGNNQPALNKERVQHLFVPIAPAEEASEIARILETAFAWIDRLASEATSARRLIGKLDQEVLAKAFRGDLVPQHLDDEPATKLLERIANERAAAPKAKRGRMRKA
ncbi:restriction endonuclease subunit S [Agrobacterium sp. CFBP2214]|jgi:type I restriction enzyme S subunit|uniref:restriction endonuclease subunit S n=1 Tax=Agrobacterium sp. CFBP2214 TaxID=3040274 RepID=UPI0013ED016A|nr:restriction endonuclease subunit S [Agrobacterium sp. CFBP2214]